MAGISETVSITLLPEVTRAIRPPRALSVPFRLGYPLGAPDDPPLQRRVLRAMLTLAGENDVPALRVLDAREEAPRGATARRTS